MQIVSQYGTFVGKYFIFHDHLRVLDVDSTRIGGRARVATVVVVVLHRRLLLVNPAALPGLIFSGTFIPQFELFSVDCYFEVHLIWWWKTGLY